MTCLGKCWHYVL